eukprot:4174775-Pyramimonas_sp.AAC.1
MPLTIDDHIKRSFIPWSSARRLQLIPSALPRDHVPIIVEFTAYQHRSQAADFFRWDRDKLAAALQEGADRLEFQEDLEIAFTQSTELAQYGA